MRSITKQEQWKVIRSNPNYEVSDQGNVRNTNTGKSLTTYRGLRGGYVCVKLWKNGKIDGRRVHRLVCEAFNGAPPDKDMDCAHWDGDKLNNSPENLRWTTRKQNEADKKRHGKDNRGERNGGAKITDEEVVAIKKAASLLPRSSGGKRIKKGAIDPVAEQYGVTKSCIQNIIHGRRKSCHSL